MRVLRKYAFVALLSARTNMVYLAEVMSRVVFLGVILYIFTCLWQVVFRQAGANRLGELSLQQMIWYLTVTEAITLSAPRVSANVDLDVRSGALVSYLHRPISYPLYSLASSFGERSVRLFVNLGVGAFVATILVGVPPLSWQAAVFFLAALPLALVVDFLGCFLIGLGAFWLEDTSGIFLIYSRLTMMLGGMLFPITFYPDAFRKIVQWLPFSAVLYGPAKMLVLPTADEFVLVLLRQLIGVALFGSLVWLTYKFASKRVFVNGG